MVLNTGGVGMKKIKITRKQEKLIEQYRETQSNEGAIKAFVTGEGPGANDVLAEFTPEQFALLFMEWYEVLEIVDEALEGELG